MLPLSSSFSLSKQLAWLEPDPSDSHLARNFWQELCRRGWLMSFTPPCAEVSPPCQVLLLWLAHGKVMAKSIRRLAQAKVQDISDFSPTTCLSYTLKEGN